jgi:hypothetical protein
MLQVGVTGIKKKKENILLNFPRSTAGSFYISGLSFASLIWIIA